MTPQHCNLCTLPLTAEETEANLPGPYYHAICRNIQIAANSAQLQQEETK